MADERLNIRRVSLQAVVAVLLTSVYFLSGKLGLSLAFVNSSTSAVWPPTGIALAVLLIFGYRVWPCIFIGAFLVNLTTTGTIATSLGIALGNTFEGLIGAYLVNRYANGRNTFDRPRDIFRFVLFAVLFSPMISASIGVTTLELRHLADWKNFSDVWFTWWIGDAVGCIVVAPLIVLWSTKPLPAWNRKKIIETGLLVLSLFVISFPTLNGSPPLGLRNYPLEFLSISILIWAAFRVGQQEATTMTCVMSAIAIWGTLHGIGPFVRNSINESL